ncbi:hypothetical protein [Blastococcus sp. SYSU D00695]
MRRQTQWALAGVLAGTAMLGVTGTLAGFTDSESVDASAGAGTLDLQVETEARAGQRLQLHAQHVEGGQVTARLVGSSAATLSVSVDAPSGPCRLPDVVVSFSVPGRAIPVAEELCDLAAGPVELTGLDAATPSVDVVVRVAAGSAPRQGAVNWDGALRFDLRQGGGGFSDTALVDVRVHVPNGVGNDTRGGGPRNG